MKWNANARTLPSTCGNACRQFVERKPSRWRGCDLAHPNERFLPSAPLVKQLDDQPSQLRKRVFNEVMLYLESARQIFYRNAAKRR